MSSALDLLDALIADLEARLNLAPGDSLPNSNSSNNNNNNKKKEESPSAQNLKLDTKKKDSSSKHKKDNDSKSKNNNNSNSKPKSAPVDQPEICKLEFKVGVITKVWEHPDADKLYCEEIDCGEGEPRQIASGLRPYYTLEQMMGQRLLVVSNLKPKNLVGFKSFGMVLCASTDDKVEFIEPPEGAELGEVVTFEGLPAPIPMSGSQVEKKKVFQNAMEGMKTDDSCVATWDGHAFMTSAGPCKSKTVAGAPMR